ncbi:hypothetical protein F4694_006447 [Bacillus niacini]|uniref:Uncharacterized protein n=1 Tax=Neobacillus niacini TaxID=86668 RepID=A0A852TMT5_9BACI|nr:hypothetical protein [Neobacillus niacini]
MKLNGKLSVGHLCPVHSYNAKGEIVMKTEYNPSLL